MRLGLHCVVSWLRDGRWAFALALSLQWFHLQAEPLDNFIQPRLEWRLDCAGGGALQSNYPVSGVGPNANSTFNLALGYAADSICPSPAPAGDVSALGAYATDFVHGREFTASPQGGGFKPYVSFFQTNQCAEYAALGLFTALSWQTTIASISGNVYTPTTYPGVDQCFKHCGVQQVAVNDYIPYYIPPNHGVGDTIYLVYDSHVVPRFCNPGTGNDQPALGQEAVPSGAQDTGSITGGGGDQACVDANEDGIDDDTHNACVADCTDADADGVDDATGDICGLTGDREKVHRDYLDGLRSVGAGIGAGTSTLSDFAAKFGGIFELPGSILGYLNTAPTCTMTIDWESLGGWLGGATGLQAVDWCAVKGRIEPYLNFGMYIMTVFALYTIFYRSAE